MKKLKNIKKILILLLAIVTVFSISGVTSYAETKPFGGIDVDLDLYEITVREADDSFITDLTSAENVVFTNNEEYDINLSIRSGRIYGSPSNLIKSEYNSNIKLQYASTFTFNWGTQQLRTLEPLTFVNKVPESVNVPVPFYFEEGEQAGS